MEAHQNLQERQTFFVREEASGRSFLFLSFFLLTCLYLLQIGRILHYRFVADLDGVEMRKLFDFMADPVSQFETGLDNRFALIKWIEKKSETRKDQYCVTKSFGPISSREYLVANSKIWNPEKAFLLFYSIERPDVPPVHKRAEVQCTPFDFLFAFFVELTKENHQKLSMSLSPFLEEHVCQQSHGQT